MTHQRNETPEPLVQEQAGEPKRKFPKRILALLEFVADRHPPEGLAPYEDEHGEPMQDDADAALAWISTNTAALQAKDAEIARLKADAGRYRWLRDEDADVPNGMRELCVVQDRLPHTDEPDKELFGSYLDAAIDAAMKGEAA